MEGWRASPWVSEGTGDVLCICIRLVRVGVARPQMQIKFHMNQCPW